MAKKKYDRKYSVSYWEERTKRGYFEKIYLYPGEDEKDLDRKMREKIRNPNTTTTFVATEEKI